MVLIFHWAPLMTQLERQLLCEAETLVHSHVHARARAPVAGSLPLTLRRLRGSAAERASICHCAFIWAGGNDDGGEDRWEAGGGALVEALGETTGAEEEAVTLISLSCGMITKIPFHVRRSKYRLSLIL